MVQSHVRGAPAARRNGRRRISSVNARQPITIVGGGLAGLTLGIGLRERGVPVAVFEAGTYPRHRVCGEFISGRGLALLQQGELNEVLAQAGGRVARTVQFFLGNRSFPIRPLPRPALCLSRYSLDALLADKFRQLGGDLRCGTRRADTAHSQGVVRASGRRVQAEQGGSRWFGLKAHTRNVALQADLEMHFSANSYVGLCRLPDDEVNVCGLFRRTRTDAPLPQNAVERLCVESSEVLSERLRQAGWDKQSFCSVGGLPFRAALETAPAECCIGDALAMIPPVTGNGMSMAFESARLALGPLMDYAEGRVDWERARQTIAHSCRAMFGPRLFLASRLHAMLFQTTVRSLLLPPVLSSDFLWRLFFRFTR